MDKPKDRVLVILSRDGVEIGTMGPYPTYAEAEAKLMLRLLSTPKGTRGIMRRVE